MTVGGDRLAKAPLPVPDKLTICGLPGPLSVMLTTAVRFPGTAGVKVTLTWQFALGARVGGHVLFSEKSPAFGPPIAIAEIETVARPVFVSVTACGELVTPIACGGKVRKFVSRLRTGNCPWSRISVGFAKSSFPSPLKSPIAKGTAAVLGGKGKSIAL